MYIPEDLLLAAADSMSNVEEKGRHIFLGGCAKKTFFLLFHFKIKRKQHCRVKYQIYFGIYLNTKYI